MLLWWLFTISGRQAAGVPRLRPVRGRDAGLPTLPFRLSSQLASVAEYKMWLCDVNDFICCDLHNTLTKKILQQGLF
jgi:hypothetical protein